MKAFVIILLVNVGGFILETTNTKKFAYIRVSYKDQNLARQIDSLKQYVDNERDIFADKMSGKDFNRPAFQTLKNIVRAGDTIYVHEMERLGRNKQEILDNLREFKAKGVIIRILNIPTTMIDFSAYDSKLQKMMLEMINNIMIEVMATFAENERDSILKRQREGIDAAVRRGVKFGRPAKNFPETWPDDYAAWKAGEVTAVSLYKKYGMSCTTFYNNVKKWEQEQINNSKLK